MPDRSAWPRAPLVARALAAVVLVAASIAMAGWILEVPPLTTLLLSWPPLLPLNAVTLGLLSGSVISQAESPRARIGLGRTLAWVAALLATLVVVEHVTGGWPNLDNVLFADGLPALPGEEPGRPTLPAALSEVMLAVALGLLRHDRVPAVGLGVAGLASGMTVPVATTLAYLYTTSSASEVAAGVGMTPTVALSLTALSVATVCARPSRPPLAWYLKLTDRGTPARLGAVFLGLPLVVWLVRDVALAGGLSLEAALLLGLMAGTVVTGGGVYLLSRVQTRAVERELAQERAGAESRAALARLYEDYSDLLQRIPVGVFRLRLGADGSRHLEYVSRAFGEQLGVPVEELLRDVEAGLAQIHPEDLASLQQVIEGASSGEGGFTWEGRTRGAGTAEWLNVEGTVTLNGDGDRLVDGMQQDISARKRSEAELIEAHRLAEAASHAKSSFLANVSHEIRTPLNGVLGLLRLLRDSGLDPRQRDYAVKAERAALALLQILNDVLDYSKIEAGHLELHVERLELDHLLRELSVTMSANLGDKPVDLLFDVDPKAPRWVSGDGLRLRQILLNLCSNAMKFTDSGEVRLAVTVVGSTRESVRLRMAVSDTGIGISPEARSRIFEGFVQADSDTTRRFGGTGLGLSITQRLLGLMGSELILDSEPGRGSTFSFEVDLAQAEGPTEDRPSSPMHGLRVLVVGGRPASQNLLVGMCRSWGWEPEPIADLDAAATAVTTARATGRGYDLVLLDGPLGEPLPWAAARRLRDRIEAAAGSPPPAIIVVASGVAHALPPEGGADQRAVDVVLVKPVTASMIYDAVASVRLVAGPAALAPTATGQRLAGLRVVLAEDNVLNQEVAAEVMRRQGAEVLIAADGRRAVDLVRAGIGDIDLVLLDMQMPVMDGLEAARLIRSDPRAERLPLVAMTANASDADRDACLAAGMDEHLAKPYDPDDLVAVIERLTSQRGKRAVGIDSAGGADGSSGGDGPSAGPLPVPAGLVVLDVDAALARVGGQRAFLDRMLGRLVDGLPAALAEIEAAAEAGDQAQVARLAHSLKGSASMVGAVALAAAAADIEDRAKSAAPPGRSFSLDDLSAAAAAARAAVTVWRMG